MHDVDLRLVRATYDGEGHGLAVADGPGIGESLFARLVPEDAVLIERALRQDLRDGRAADRGPLPGAAPRPS